MKLKQLLIQNISQSISKTLEDHLSIDEFNRFDFAIGQDLHLSKPLEKFVNYLIDNLKEIDIKGNNYSD